MKFELIKNKSIIVLAFNYTEKNKSVAMPNFKLVQDKTYMK